MNRMGRDTAKYSDMSRSGRQSMGWWARTTLILYFCCVGNARATCPAPAEPALEVPEYVIKYAPLVWLHSEDPYNPSDIGTQVTNAIPQINHTTLANAPAPLTLENLDALNALGGTNVFLTSREGIRALPAWFRGVRPNAQRKTEGAISSAIVVADRGDRDGQAGVVDAFYFYFYAYNRGNTVLGMEFGDHVGDWEHNMIRFKHGEPQAVWYSQHSSGQAFTFEATDKLEGRPVAFSANGSHAVYATSGTHDHTLPGLDLPEGFLEDEADQGTLWDPTLSAWVYRYSAASSSSSPFTPYASAAAVDPPVQWLMFEGQWGDEQLPDGWEGQYDLFGQRKYTSGPNGPRFKDLDRNRVCPDSVSMCLVMPFLQ